jgi:serine/threonine-protein kinase haspin
MEPTSKPKCVAQRRVYGKRRANAPRAVFDGSPARDSASKRIQHVDPVESIQAKLAEVTIDDPPSPPEEISETPKCRGEEQQELIESPSEGSIFSSAVGSLDTETTQSSAEPSPEEPKKFQTMVEVRIYNKPAKKLPKPTTQSASTSSEPKSPISESPVTAREPTGEDEERPNALERKRVARKKVPVSRRSSGVVHDNKASEYVRPILNEALSPLAAQSIQKFGSWASRSANMFDVAKLAEGSYGEVYKLHLREEACRPVVSKSKLAKLKSYGDGVFKVVPLRAKSGPGSKKFTSIDEIVSEVKMLKYLDPIPGFARFREIHVVQGRFPESFQNAWDHYKKTKDDCMNPNPSNKRAYPDTQLWAIIEMDDAGCELEKFAWSSIFQIYDIFWGVAMALARAEEYAMFEHRDLHLGNVCIRSTREDGCMDPPTEHDIARQSSSSGFGISALETTIIDYSLSRADLLLSDDPSGLTEIASSDLDKKQLFDAIGEDEDEIMQRNTYR